MKNILYIAPYRQRDGWGQAAYNYLQSLIYATEKLGHNLKIAPAYFTGQVWDFMKSESDAMPELEKYENVNINKFDTIIQKGLPESLCYNYGTNNIAMTVLETQNMQHTKNKHILNKFDHILVPSSMEKQTLIRAGIVKPVHNILEPINCEEIDNHIQQNGPVTNHKYSGYVKFYFIGEFVHRKNILDLMVAFSLAFRSTDKVMLFIKTSQSASQAYINSQLAERFKKLKHSSFNTNIVLMNKRLSRQELLNLHNLSDIFICPSHGEAFCIPLAEAMRFGNIPVIVNHTGPMSFVNDKNGYIIPSRPEVCLADEGADNLDTYSSNEVWMSPSIYDIVHTLKRAREDMLSNKELVLSKKKLARQTTDSLTFQSIGDTICSLEIV